MNLRNNLFLKFLNDEEYISAAELSLKSGLGLRTVQRIINSLEEFGYILKHGDGRNTKYKISGLGKLNYIPNYDQDLSENRLEQGVIHFEKYIFNWLSNFRFEKDEIIQLENAKKLYQNKIKQSSLFLKNKEFERLVVEFSWKSSSIEGDTYSLLDTEKLLLEGIPNLKKSSDDAKIVLNHKEAINYIFQNPGYFKVITSKKINELHNILTNGLNISLNYRKSGVGVTGSLYKPLDNYHQINEVMDSLAKLVNRAENHFMKAFFVSLLIPYIQPFEDGNKRTSRLLCNAILYNYDLPLISYRTTAVEDYRNAVLCFYELNSIQPLKKIFIEQIVYFSKNYF
jgi:Fic family protein